MVNISLKFFFIFFLLYSINVQWSEAVSEPIIQRVPRSVQGTPKDCQVPAREAVQTVSNGEVVPDRYYPWHVSIFKTKRLSNLYICGGSIISTSYIITAAHCLHEENLVIIDDRLFIRAGSNKMAVGDHYGINKKIIHRDYNSLNFQSDIALLQTLNEIKFSRNVKPVCYTKTDFIYINKEAWIPGWGLTENQTAGVTDNLNHAKMPGRTRDDCEERNPSFYKDYVNDKNFCAGNVDTTSICRGDSGGGLVLKRNDGWYIRGIASMAPSAKTRTFDVCDLTQFVLFTDVVSFAEWIDYNIQSTNRMIMEPSTKRPTIEPSIKRPIIELSTKRPIMEHSFISRKSKKACDKYIKDKPVIIQKVDGYGTCSIDYPHNCVLRHRNPDNNSRCGGTLISDQWILTGAIAVDLYADDISSILVILGTDDLLDADGPGITVAVEELIVHPNHNKMSKHNDIALIKLTKSVQFTNEIHPACLYMDDNGPPEGTRLTLTGFSPTRMNETASDLLVDKVMEISSYNRCNNTLFEYGIISSQICASGTYSVCQGDSGGPLQLILNQEKRISSVVGIASHGTFKCNTGVDIYTRVSSYLDWIEEHVWPEDNSRKCEKACEKYLKDRQLISLPEDLYHVNSMSYPHNCVMRHPDKNSRCGGTLISDQWVLTSANCKLNTKTRVLLGRGDLRSNDRRFYEIEKKIDHPNYSKISKHNDIALIKLTESVEFTDEIHPACLYMDDNGPPEGTELTLTGFGRKHKKRRLSDLLLEKFMEVSPINRCNDTYASKIISSQICANGTVGACQGDDGGSLTFLLYEEKQISAVVGIVSVASDCGSEDGVFTRVSSYLDWIEEHVWPEDNSRKCEKACDKYLKDRQPISLPEDLDRVNSIKYPHNCVLRHPDNNSIFGGSLISDRWVLTSAHCSLTNLTIVYLGTDDLLSDNDPGITIAIEDWFVHTNYSKNAKHNDIALIKLAKSVQFSDRIYPACLYTNVNGPVEGTELFLTGYGTTQILSKPLDVLIEKMLTVSPTNRCKDTYSEYQVDIISSQICANGIIGACQGDGGGPLQLLLNQEKRISSIVGIASFGSSVCDTEDGVYTRVSSYLDWIEEHVWPDEIKN